LEQGMYIASWIWGR